VYNFKFNYKQRYLVDSVVKAWYKNGLTFDMKFDLTTDEKMYCSEFVSKAITIATDRTVTFSTTRLNKFEFIALDNLYLNKFCIETKRIRY
jgi:hypothetical protein